jgi:hypothetical protein
MKALGEFEVMLCCGLGKDLAADVVRLHAENAVLGRSNLRQDFETVMEKICS